MSIFSSIVSSFNPFGDFFSKEEHDGWDWAILFGGLAMDAASLLAPGVGKVGSTIGKVALKEGVKALRNRVVRSVIIEGVKELGKASIPQEYSPVEDKQINHPDIIGDSPIDKTDETHLDQVPSIIESIFPNYNLPPLMNPFIVQSPIYTDLNLTSPLNKVGISTMPRLKNSYRNDDDEDDDEDEEKEYDLVEIVYNFKTKECWGIEEEKEDLLKKPSNILENMIGKSLVNSLTQTGKNVLIDILKSEIHNIAGSLQEQILGSFEEASHIHK